MHEAPTAPPDDMEELLRNPPKSPYSCPTDTSLWLGGLKLNDNCAKIFARSLMSERWVHLTYLNISRNDITCDGMAAIAAALAQGKAPKLEQINLSELPLGDAGIVAFAASLGAVPLLRSIETCQCGYGETGTVAMMTAAKQGFLKNLSQWYVKGNPIGDGGMEAICEGLASGQLPKLDLVNLCETKVGDEGLLCLANHIEEGHLDTVRIISLSQIMASRDGFEVVNDVIKEYDKKIRVDF